MSEPADPPAPFRDHERWVAHQQLLYGGAAWVVCSLLLAVIGYSVAMDALVVETVEGVEAATYFAVDVRGPMLGPLAASAVGFALAVPGFGYLKDARTRREIAARRNMVESMVAVVLLGTILQAIIEASRGDDSDA